MKFTHLRVASGYSARYGDSLPGALVQRAAERGMTTLALISEPERAAALGRVVDGFIQAATNVPGAQQDPAPPPGGPQDPNPA